MRVRFTKLAVKQYLDGLRYIRSRDPEGAASVQQRAEAVIELLREHPESGHPIPEFPELPHRELPVPPYRFFYRSVVGTVWIVAAWHARQIPERPDATERG